ncbi:MAG: nitroreductase family protein [Spirochaetes bacterium]|nr:nitroreductase family protein [Spirochaetota bacterium]
MKNDVLSAASLRRSIYAFGKNIPVSESRICEIVEEALKQTPSLFNIQSARAIILFGSNHDELWNYLLGIMKGLVKDPAAFAQTEAKLAGFKRAKGTVLFFEDQTPVKAMQETFPLYADKFPPWSLQSSGMAQFLVWTAFAQEGVGANLQHYDPLIDEWIYRKTGVPSSWKVISQMTFGEILSPAGEKSYQPIEARVSVLA